MPLYTARAPDEPRSAPSFFLEKKGAVSALGKTMQKARDKRTDVFLIWAIPYEVGPMRGVLGFGVPELL